MLFAWLQSMGPRQLRPIPKMSSLLLPILSLMIHAGSSRKKPKMNQSGRIGFKTMMG